MALQINCDIEGSITITNAIHEIHSIHINKLASRARIDVNIYKDTAERDAGNQASSKSFTALDANFTTYFDTVDGTKTILTKAQDYLLNEEAYFSGATVI